MSAEQRALVRGVPPGSGGRTAPFVSRFLLPLVKGGALHVGRPLGRRAIARMIGPAGAGPRRGFSSVEDLVEEDAMAELGRLRLTRARGLLYSATTPSLDETTLRLGVAVHNLLALGHPDLGAGLAAGLAGRALERRQEQIVEATVPIADLGPPATAEEALNRHSLLARLPEITRTETTVEYWAGRRRFVGQTPPAALLALPRVRRVSSTSMRRLWFKEVGVPAAGRLLLIALHRASPLGEALDPLRLDPPLAWERILPVLRFAPLCRVAAGHLVELGLERAGAPMVAALQKFASMNAPPVDVAFAIRFLAHASWLQHLYRPREPISATSELAALLVAAAEIEPGLVWPPDVPASAALFTSFSTALDALGSEVRARIPDRHRAALILCRFATSAGTPTPLL